MPARGREALLTRTAAFPHPQDVIKDALKRTVDSALARVHHEVKLTSVSGVLHWAAHPLLSAAGWTWEVRRSGEVSIGLWRKSLQSKSKRRFVLIPGFADTPLSWLGVLRLAQRTLRGGFGELVLVDFPGFLGTQSRKTPFHSFDLLMRCLSEVLKSLEPSVILGHSLGGWLAAHYALEAPLEELILVAPSGVLLREDEKKQWSEIFHAERSTDTRSVQLRNRRLMGRPLPILGRVIRRELDHFFDREEVKLFLNSVHSGHFLNERLSHLKSKVNLIWGAEDEICFTRWLDDWKALLPAENVSAQVLKGTGHLPHLQSPRLMARALAKALS